METMDHGAKIDGLIEQIKAAEGTLNIKAVEVEDDWEGGLDVRMTGADWRAVIELTDTDGKSLDGYAYVEGAGGASAYLSQGFHIKTLGDLVEAVDAVKEGAKAALEH